MGVGVWPIHRHAQSLAEVFPLDAIVYLSPDAEEPLEVGLRLCLCLILFMCVCARARARVCVCVCVCGCGCGWGDAKQTGQPTIQTPPSTHQTTPKQKLDLHKVYVIGGIVDRSIVRGVTVRAAKGLGVCTARLPLEHLNVGRGGVG